MNALPHVKQKLIEIKDELCDGFTLTPYAVGLRIHGIAEELHGEIVEVDDAQETVSFFGSNGRNTTFHFAQIVAISD